MSDVEKKIAEALEGHKKRVRQTLEREPQFRGSITQYFHDGWFKGHEITIRKKPEE